ncbi:MAG: translation initiation factor IF-2 [Alphaproteobacteria bacterium]|nr:translation initiation factor IF-2 [Alphaproteobacteria bacterium]
MEDNINGERKKLSLSSGGKLTLKNSLSSKASSITTNSRSGRGTVQVEVKRTKRPSLRMGVNENAQPKNVLDNNTGLSAKEIQSRSRMLQEGLAKTAAEAEIIAAEKYEKAKLEEARIAATADEASKAASSLAPKDKMLARRKAETEEIIEIKKIEEEQKKLQTDARKAEEAALQAEKDRQKLADAETLPLNSKYWGTNKVQEKEVFKENLKKPSWNRGFEEKRQGKMTIARALDSDNVRVRSLASIKRRREKARMQADQTPAVKQFREVTIPDTITVSELANRMTEKTADVVRELMKNGIMATATEVIDAETAELITTEFGHKPKRISESDVELDLEIQESDPKNMVSRPPIVTIMGHVDHGKTSLLDALRQSKVVDTEAGGITQHIGAYQITTKSNSKISFIDTPGHEAFTEMRARGANVTDIVILVVAADDGIKPQTIEAIKHAKAASCPIIVAVNKCDKPEANPKKVRTELLQHEIIPEEMGGDIQCIDVSAKNKEGLDNLIEALELQAELMELKSDPTISANGVVIEAKVEKGKGSVITMLVKAGTLNVGDILVVGSESGKVRALLNDLGMRVKSAGPSTPVEVLGLSGTPMAGDLAHVVESESRAREIAEYRSRKSKQKEARLTARGSVEQMLANIQAGEQSELPVIIKTDVHGSLEAIKVALDKLGNSSVKVKILSGGVGAISESDITLASASSALVLAFNVRAIPQARELSRRDNVEIRYHSIIYELIEDAKLALTGMLDPDLQESFIGYAEIRQVFSVSKVGKIAGCYVTEGIVKKGCSFRLLRDNTVIHQGMLKTLRRFKDEVKEVREGTECGMGFENYNDIQEGDVMECFEVKEVARSLDTVDKRVG